MIVLTGIPSCVPAEWGSEAPEEYTRAELWVLEQLLKLGFPADHAQQLLRAKADWHQVAGMIAAGATCAKVLEILL